MDLALDAAPLIDPVDGLRKAVERRRWLWPLLFVAATAALAAVAFYLRWDASSTVVGELAKSGDLQRTTEQDLIEQIHTRERLQLVLSLCGAMFGTPLVALGLSLAIKIAGWLFGAKSKLGLCFAAACLALLPLGVRDLARAVVLFAHAGVTLEQAQSLIPTNVGAFWHWPGKWARVAPTLDLFQIWSAVLLGFGYAASSNMRRHRAVLMCLGLYAAWAAVFVVAMPGLTGGG